MKFNETDLTQLHEDLQTKKSAPRTDQGSL